MQELRLRPVYVAGSSGLAMEMAQLIRQVPSIGKFAGYVSAEPYPTAAEGTLPFGEIVGDDQWLLNREGESSVVIGAGFPSAREHIFHLYEASRVTLPNLSHPTVEIDPETVSIGLGNTITKGVVATCRIRIGSGNLLNWNTTIGHETVIGDFNVINPGANIGGCVRIGNGALIGTGAQVLQGVQIGDGSIVGAGAVVTRDVASGVTVTGIPARVTKGPVQ